MIKLHHLSARSLAEAGVFASVSSYEALTEHIIRYGEEVPADYDTRVGAALEVFAEFFFARYGQPSNPHLGVLNVAHTSMNKYQTGYDFAYTDFAGEPGHIQVKFRRNPTHKFTRDELGTFISMADEDGVPRERRILFTNQHHDKLGDPVSVFHPSYTGGIKQMRVIDRSYQETFIDRDPLFWTDLAHSVAVAGEAPTEFAPIRTMYDHQQRMFDACYTHLTTGGDRGRAICATGGGKTEVMFQLVKKFADDNLARVSIMVAPTIDLLRQHHAYFEQFGTFHRGDTAVIHFRTGDEARQDDYIDYMQTTKSADLTAALDVAKSVGKKVMIFVTYASEEHLFGILRNAGIMADLCLWDEFHHTVRQEIQYRNHLMTLPVKHSLFFSASQKRGRIVSSLDEEVYGPLLSNVTYAELRAVGILVPNVVIKPLRINTTSGRLTGISHQLKKIAARDKFDLRDGLTEAAAAIVARADMIRVHNNSNIITFSKGVPICKALKESTAVGLELMGALIQTVHADVPARERKRLYDQIKMSTDSILFQYAVVKEGIDITPFNALIISRNLDMIGTQQGIGRIVRAHPEDTANLKAGKITVDSPEGWKKYTATVYVIMSNEEMSEYTDRLRDLIRKLQFAGLTDDDYQFGEIIEERNGMNDENDADVPIINHDELFDMETLREMVARMQVQIEEDDRIVEQDRTIDLLVAKAPTLGAALNSIDQFVDFAFGGKNK